MQEVHALSNVNRQVDCLAEVNHQAWLLVEQTKQRSMRHILADNDEVWQTGTRGEQWEDMGRVEDPQALALLVETVGDLLSGLSDLQDFDADLGRLPEAFPRCATVVRLQHFFNWQLINVYVGRTR